MEGRIYSAVKFNSSLCNPYFQLFLTSSLYSLFSSSKRIQSVLAKWKMACLSSVLPVPIYSNAPTWWQEGSIPTGLLFFGILRIELKILFYIMNYLCEKDKVKLNGIQNSFQAAKFDSRVVSWEEFCQDMCSVLHQLPFTI